MAGTMGNAGKNRRTRKARALVLAVLACAWLILAGAGAAVSSGGATTVRVTVMDEVGVSVGTAALSAQPGTASVQVTTGGEILVTVTAL